MVRVRISGLRPFYVDESPHKDRNPRVCVCSDDPLNRPLNTLRSGVLRDVFTRCSVRGGLLSIISLINLGKVFFFPPSVNRWSIIIHQPSVCDRALPLGQRSKITSNAEETLKRSLMLHRGGYLSVSYVKYTLVSLEFCVTVKGNVHLI